MPSLRWILVTLPAQLFDLWWRVYTVALCLFVMLVVTLTVLTLLLDSVGVRWGW
jgi:hypothetical protein